MQCIVGLLALLVKQKYYANSMPNNSHCSGMVRTVERVRRMYSCSW